MTTDPQTSNPPKPNPWADFGPLLLFFVIYFIYGIIPATISLMVSMPIAMFWSWRTRKHVPRIMWVSLILVLIFGGITIYLDDIVFLQLKTTVFFSVIGLILVTAALMGKPLLKYLMDVAMPDLSEKGWLLYSRNFGLFFLFEAGLNEFVRLNFSADVWVTFKTFGLITLTFVFVLSQMPLIMKHSKPAKPTGN